MNYPKRPPHFAHKFCRKLTKTAVANALGPEVCWMLTVIAHQEDAKRYTGPVNYWNEQLMGVTGLGSVDRLNRIRAAAIKAGWLFYKPGGKGRVGLYWVLIPEWAEKLSDGSSDESEPSDLQSQNTRTSAEPNQNQTKTKPERNQREAEDKCGTSNPFPSPVPIPDPGAGAAEAAADAVVKEWNRLKGVRHCQSLSKSRRDKVNTRLRETWWRGNWLAAIGRIPGANWLHANDRGWKADLDWFLRPDTAAKLLEGKYDDAGRANGTKRANSHRHPEDEAEDWNVRDDT